MLPRSDSIATTERPNNPSIAFRSTTECRENVELKVNGSLPSWLSGVLYRCGPGQFEIDSLPISHWFDGLSQVHRLQIIPGHDDKESQILYCNRFTSEGLMARVRKDGGKFNDVTFGQQTPPRGFFEKVALLFRKNPDNGPSDQNIDVTIDSRFPFANDDGSTRTGLVTRTDANMLQELDYISLLPKQVFTYTEINEDLQGLISAAHALRDESTGEVFNYVLNFGPSSVYHVFAISESNPKGRVIADIQVPRAAYIHSFSITKKYVILVAYPLYYKANGMTIRWHRNVMDSLKWDGEKPTSQTHIYVIDRQRNRHVATYRTRPFFSFHHINAWDILNEDGTSDVVFECVAYENADSIRTMTVENLRIGGSENTSSSLCRCTLRNTALAEEKKSSILPFNSRGLPEAALDYLVNVDGFSFDMPTFDSSRNHMKPTRYVYCVATRSALVAERLVKFDNTKKTITEWKVANCMPSEPIFVPDPSAPLSDEDAGVLLSVVLDYAAKKSFLVVLNAKTMKEIARAVVPQVICFGFHGEFCKDSHA